MIPNDSRDGIITALVIVGAFIGAPWVVRLVPIYYHYFLWVVR